MPSYGQPLKWTTPKFGWQAFNWLALPALIFLVQLNVSAARSDTRSFDLSFSIPLQQYGLLDYMLPRFTLKTRVRVEVVAAGDPVDLALSTKPLGSTVFQNPETVWYLHALNFENATVRQFEQWLRSEIGLRTVAAFKVDVKVVFKAAKLV